MNKTLYHLRHPNGVSVDMMDSTRGSAVAQAATDKCQCYELSNGVATLIYEPPVIRPIKEG
jgi:hypothetical protein